MTSLRQHMIAALQLSGKSERTPQTSVRAVRLLAQFDGQSPALISSQPRQPSVLHRHNDEGLSPSSRRLCSSALRFFSHQGLERPWQTLACLRAQTAQRLPAVLRPSPIITPLASRTTLPWKPYPLDSEGATRGFLAQEIEVTAAGHLYPAWLDR
jgi:hypothetical protein